jgi:hypothetical protein
MRFRFHLRAAAAGLALLTLGCTSLREVPPSQFAAEPERRHVRVVTREGLLYEFDYVAVSNDSLIGYRRRETTGPAEEYATVPLPLHDIQTLASRRIDWYRTGLIGGGVLAALVVKGLSDSSAPADERSSGGGGPGGREQ